MAHADMFLKIDGIDGESLDDKHRNEIHIHSYHFGAQNTGAGLSNGAIAVGKVQDIHFTKHVDKSSPNLFINCCSGKSIPTAVLTVRKAGEKPQEYMIVTLSDVIVSSYDHKGGDSDELPVENVSLTFSKIKYEYKPQAADGTLGATVTKTFDLKANRIS
jgi:type VI secretion system secreted protein Hcp